MATKQGIEQIKLDEGFRERVYKDTKGLDTVGYGYNLDANPQKLSAQQIRLIRTNGISEEFAEQLLLTEVNDVENALHLRLDFWSKLTLARKDVLINMGYNLGVGGLMQFKHTLQLIRFGHYEDAAEAMLASLWSKQVKGRAQRLANLMRKGEY